MASDIIERWKASALSTALTIYPCQIRVHQRWQSKLHLPTAWKKEWWPATAGSSPHAVTCQHCDTHYFSRPRTCNLPIVGWLLVRRATSSATNSPYRWVFVYCGLLIGCLSVVLMCLHVYTRDGGWLVAGGAACSTWHNPTTPAESGKPGSCRRHSGGLREVGILAVCAVVCTLCYVYITFCWATWHGGTAAAAPPPFRLGNPALCGSCPLVTPY